MKSEAVKFHALLTNWELMKETRVSTGVFGGAEIRDFASETNLRVWRN